jgi:TonB family protein
VALALSAPGWSADTEVPVPQDARELGTPAILVLPTNPDDFYPTHSRVRYEQGSPAVQACVDSTGKLLRDPEIIETSGDPILDAAAVKVAKATRYAAATNNGTALPESCTRFRVKIVLNAPATMVQPVNPDDYYPSASRSRNEQGSPVVVVCVGPNGKPLRKPKITETSGFPDLDAAAVKVAKATRYAPGMAGEDTPLKESCIKLKIRFGQAGH